MKSYIGIDPGINNGWAVWLPEQERFQAVSSKKTWEALFALDLLKDITELTVYIEDPTSWKPFGKFNQNHRLKGAGSVTARFQAIVEYCEDNNIKVVKVKLQGTPKKLTKDVFAKITGWQQTTNEHGRDAAMLVFGRK